MAEFIEDIAIRLAQEVGESSGVEGEALENLIQHLNGKFLPGELEKLATAARILAFWADDAAEVQRRKQIDA